MDEDAGPEEAFAAWAEWLGKLEKQLSAHDTVFGTQRGRHMQHPAEIIFAGMWASYRARTDGAAVHTFLAMCPPPYVCGAESSQC